MTSQDQRNLAFIKLGAWLRLYHDAISTIEDVEFQRISETVRKAHTNNAWLIEPFFNQMIRWWSEKLVPESFYELSKRYPTIGQNHTPQNIAVIPQENVPLAGFHEFASVILTGNRFYCRNSNHEFEVLQLITNKLIEIEPGFAEYIYWCDHFPKEIDAYLVFAKLGKEGAFNQYFGGKQNLIREKRVTVGVILPDDRNEDFCKFADDIFPFFGFSSRNVRKLYVPIGFTVDSFYPSMEDYAFVYQYNRYANNFDYHRSILLMDQIPFFENGFLIMRESHELHAPIGCLHFEFYTGMDDLQQKLHNNGTAIQQIVSNASFIPNAVKPGNAHKYSLFDFDDHKNVIQFLLKS